MLVSHVPQRSRVRGDGPSAPVAEGGFPPSTSGYSRGAFERDWMDALYEEHLCAATTRSCKGLNHFLQKAARRLAVSEPVSVLQVCA